MLVKLKRGQSTLEYAIIFVAILVAFLFIQTYVRRAVQGRLRSSADDIGEAFSTNGTVNYLNTRNTVTNEVMNNVMDATMFDTDTTERTGNEETPLPNEEPWTY